MAKWFNRVVSCDTLTPGFDRIDTAAAQALTGGVGNFNVDHAWELKFFTDFFESLVPGPRNSNPQLTCAEFDAIFPICVLTKVVNQVPGPNNAEFVAMQKDLNNMKGGMFKPRELANPDFSRKWSGTTAGQIQALQSLGITVDVFNQNQVKTLFDRTNLRMYNTFQGIDQRVQTEAIPIATADFSFAASYQTFMAARLAQGSQEAWEFVQKWMSTIETSIAALDPEKEETKLLQKNYDGFKNSPYASEDHYSLVANTDLAGAGGTPVAFSKRDLWARDGSCPLNQQTTTIATDESTTQVSTPTTFSTATGGQTTTEQSTTTDQTTPGTSTATTFSTATSGPPSQDSTATTDLTTSILSTPTIISTDSQESTSTRKLPSIQTVTTNGMVCILIEGSTDPQCHPLTTPTPNPDGTNIVSHFYSRQGLTYMSDISI